MFRFICVECDDKGFPDWQALSLQETDNGSQAHTALRPFCVIWKRFLQGEYLSAVQAGHSFCVVCPVPRGWRANRLMELRSKTTGE